MKYLSKEIEALLKASHSKSLVRANTSCGIFQDCDYNIDTGKLYYQKKPNYLITKINFLKINAW